MFLSMSVLVWTLLGCADQQKEYVADSSQWYHDPPVRAASGIQLLELGTVKWAFDTTTTVVDSTRMHESIRSAAPLWRTPLGCGVQLKEVNLGDQPDVVFRCEQIENYEHNGDLEVDFVKALGEKHQSVVKIDSKICKKAGLSRALHVWGHGLGFDDPLEFQLYPSIMSPGAIFFDPPESSQKKYYLGLNGRELDALRIWALEQGAPGCGADDPLWSWEDPNLGYTYSAGPSPEMLQYIQELEARAKN